MDMLKLFSLIPDLGCSVVFNFFFFFFTNNIAMSIPLGKCTVFQLGSWKLAALMLNPTLSLLLTPPTSLAP